MVKGENGVEEVQEEQQEPLLAADEQEGGDTEAGDQGFSIQECIYTHPDRAVRWLISKGALRLGSFKVQVSWHSWEYRAMPRLSVSLVIRKAQ